MLKKKTLIIGFVIIILVTALFEVVMLIDKSGDFDDGIKYFIGVSQPNLIDQWLITMSDDIQAEAEKYQDIKIIISDAAQDNKKQKQDIENMVSQGVDLLIVTPNDIKYLSDTISKVFNQGIPVILMGFPLETNNYSMLIYCDNKKIGISAAKYVSELLGEKGGRILEIQGEPILPVFSERKSGFHEEIMRYPKVKIAYAVLGYGQRDKTEIRVNEIFKKEPKVDLVFAYNDEMAIGAWRVATLEKQDVKIIGIGGLPLKLNGLDAVNKGLIDATFLYPTGGKEAIVNALKILKGEKVPKQIELQTCKITKDNINDFIK